MKIAFIDHSFHMKTLSSNFFVEILKNKGINVECLWDDSWRGGKPVVLDDIVDKYDAFIFWQQSAFSSKPLYKYNSNITFIPMLDNFGSDKELQHSRNFWKDYAGTKTLCFSKALDNACLSHGLASKHVMYYPDPKDYVVNNCFDDIRGFFWERTPDQISWDVIKNYIIKEDFKSIHIHAACDPGSKGKVISKKDILDYNITTSKWFESRKEYNELLRQYQVYFAPRKSEGIGLSYLEAMAMGKCIVAPNYGTMNDYILNGINGVLYELNVKEKIDFSQSRVTEICKMARESVEIGFKNWKSKEDEIIDFIVSKPKDIYKGYYGVHINFENLNKELSGNNNDGVGVSNLQDDILLKVKKRIHASKLKPLIYPIVKKLRKIKNSNLEGSESNKAKEIKEVLLKEPRLETSTVCSKRLRADDSEGEILKEGGLRLKGIYKNSKEGKPLVTIITVVYNCVEKIERAIQSVINQTYDNIEYIIVDGGSTDGTLEKISKYEDKIDYYLSQSDKGIYDAMNKGLSLSVGDYIGIVNADDKFYDNSIEICVNKILEEDADYCAGEDYCVDENGNFIGIFKVAFLDERSLVAQHPCNHGSMLIGKHVYDKVGGYDLKYKIGADYKLQLHIVTDKNFRGCAIYSPVHYFEMAGVSSQQRSKALEDVQNIILEFLPNVEKRCIYSLVYFMHENHWNENICSDLENLIESQVFNEKQVKFLLHKMREKGYMGKCMETVSESFNEKIDYKRYIESLSLKKIIKYLAPYGVVNMYKNYKYKDKS
ncbi:glycosyltransferase [Clostridium magnum]|uniref:PGL/p-HBAD biosynthesis glycosyltransferase n=1 Tax=Clostridium magnum DSM 2767 TaxID=1121326 RepID=A0A161WEV1_9CLOT|nr:glycosyltransferase [Clostridium magnum]KZL90195.1 PGL/p-HBAD biosynthesis glycosyltransferase [Clostridium magnum DSM 2767]SHH64093.1 Glycosyl transferases group 1 [Clostridium magnum DSM 2767]